MLAGSTNEFRSVYSTLIFYLKYLLIRQKIMIVCCNDCVLQYTCSNSRINNLKQYFNVTVTVIEV